MTVHMGSNWQVNCIYQDILWWWRLFPNYSSSRCPVRYNFWVCRKIMPTLKELSLYSIKSSSNCFVSDIILVHVPKEGIDYCKMHFHFYTTEKIFIFWRSSIQNYFCDSIFFWNHDIIVLFIMTETTFQFSLIVRSLPFFNIYNC